MKNVRCLMLWFAMSPFVHMVFAKEPIFFEFKENLFNFDGETLWHVHKSEYGTKGNITNIQFKMAELYNLEDIRMSEADLRWMFVTTSQTGCSVLVMVDRGLNYQSWNLNFEYQVGYKREIPFQLTQFNKSDKCQTALWQENGNLGEVYAISSLLNKLEAVSIIFTANNNTVLYLVGPQAHIKLDIQSDEWNNENNTELVGQLVPKGVTMKHKGLTIYRNQYALELNEENDVQVCPANIVDSIDIGSNCVLIALSWNKIYTGQTLKAANITEATTEPYIYDTETEPNKSMPNSRFIIMIVSVIAIILVLITLYMIVVRFCCKDNVATMPFSGLVSKYGKQPQSVSSIVTLDSDLEADTKKNRPPGNKNATSKKK